MRLSVEKITDIKKAYTLTLTAKDLFPEQVASDAPAVVLIDDVIQVDCSLSRIARRLLLEGRVRGRLQLNCGRCLVPFADSLDESFSLALNLVTAQQTQDEELELDEERINSIEVEDGEIDLLPLLQEQVLMLLPTYPVCRPDCAGLCPYCGIDLNRGKCDCEPQPFNNRFGKLKELKLDGSGQKES